MLLTSTRRCRGVVALEPLPEVAGALKRSLQMNGWEEKSQVRPGVLSSKCCVKIWKTWKLRMKFGWDTTNILINKRPPKKSKKYWPLFFNFLRLCISHQLPVDVDSFTSAHLEPGDPSLCRRPEWLGTHAFFGPCWWKSICQRISAMAIFEFSFVVSWSSQMLVKVQFVCCLNVW